MATVELDHCAKSEMKDTLELQPTVDEDLRETPALLRNDLTVRDFDNLHWLYGNAVRRNIEAREDGTPEGVVAWQEEEIRIVWVDPRRSFEIAGRYKLWGGRRRVLRLWDVHHEAGVAIVNAKDALVVAEESVEKPEILCRKLVSRRK